MSILFTGVEEELIYKEAADIQIKNWLKYYAKQRDKRMHRLDAEYIHRGK